LKRFKNSMLAWICQVFVKNGSMVLSNHIYEFPREARKIVHQ
jgi:hypothetical protein